MGQQGVDCVNGALGECVELLLRPAALVLASGAGGDLVAEAWRGLTGTLAVTHADGDHFQLMRRPGVKAVADALRGSTAQTGD